MDIFFQMSGLICDMRRLSRSSCDVPPDADRLAPLGPGRGSMHCTSRAIGTNRDFFKKISSKTIKHNARFNKQHFLGWAFGFA
mgnify:CR=1 FL=1